MEKADKTAFLDTLCEAQKIAFSPFIFKCVSAALKTGLLERIVTADAPLTRESLTQALRLTPYAVKVMVDLLKPAGILEETPDGLTATRLGELLVLDEMTRVNFFFTDDVNYLALDKTLDSLLEGRPAGLAAFDPSWKTIYPHLPALPEAARTSWFRFDHFHSDQAYQKALKLLGYRRPKHLVDIGGNTGRFTKLFLETLPGTRATLVDLPVETEALADRPELGDVIDRIDTVAIDWLSDSPLTGTGHADLYWMSQFLDCFSHEEALSILRRVREAMVPGASLAVLEPVVDRQRHRAAELSLAATSLYFTTVANGNSRFFYGDELEALFHEAGFQLMEEYNGLGISHSLFILRPFPKEEH